MRKIVNCDPHLRHTLLSFIGNLGSNIYLVQFKLRPVPKDRYLSGSNTWWIICYIALYILSYHPTSLVDGILTEISQVCSQLCELGFHSEYKAKERCDDCEKNVKVSI